MLTVRSSSSSNRTEIDPPASTSSFPDPPQAQTMKPKMDQDSDDEGDEYFLKLHPMPMSVPRVLRSSSRNKGKEKAVFQEVLTPAPRQLRSSTKNKGRGMAKLEESSMPSPPALRLSKLDREASFLQEQMANVSIQSNSYPRSSSNNTASTSINNSISDSGNVTSPTSDTEYELDSSIKADSAALSPSTLAEFNSYPHPISENKIQHYDEADVDLVNDSSLSLLTSKSESESESSDDDDVPLAFRNNHKCRRSTVMQKRKDMENFVLENPKRRRLVRGDQCNHRM